jgi:hypothetical protein
MMRQHRNPSGQTTRRRVRSRPRLEALEDRLAPNNLSALGALVIGPDGAAPPARPTTFQDQATPSVAPAQAQRPQYNAPAPSKGSPSQTSAPTVASSGPAQPLIGLQGVRASAAGAAWDAGLIDLSSIVGSPDAPARSQALKSATGAGNATGSSAASARPAAPTERATPPAAPTALPIAGATAPAAAPFVSGVGAGTSGQVRHATSAAPPAPTAGTLMSVTRQISLGGTTTISPAAAGLPGGSETLVFPKDPGGDAGDGSGDNGPPAGTPSTVASARVAPSNPGLVQSFHGLNAYDQRYANGGNQFQVVPPDQGLAVGNGKVLEVVNDVLRVYDTSGKPLTGVEDLNTFFGYAAQVNRDTGDQGPFVTDPSAYFDQPTQRWFVDALTLDVDTSGNYLGTDHIDIAVSQTADPTGGWNIYRLAVQDDGTQGTPNHGDASYGGPFFGDYPHIGADGNGIYITTNEFQLFGDGSFRAAQVYAFSKTALASGAASLPVAQFDTIGANLGGYPGFTLIPSLTPGASYAGGQGGSEYFLSSSDAVYNNATGSDNVLGLWSMTNTKSLANPNPSPSLSYSVLTVNTYTLPPLANQKAGNFPLGQSLNDPTLATELFGEPDTFAPEVESALESLDTRMTQVTYANGKLWGALDTAVNVGGHVKAGIEWFVINPNAGGSGRVDNQGVLALAGNNLIFPAIAVTASGKGVMGFSVAGNDYYPSAGYAPIDANKGVGDIHIAASGVGPEDEFSSYGFFQYDTPRFGDYGAAVADGNTIWVANEYIANAGNVDQYVADQTLGGTRAMVTNWDTRVTQVQV